MPLHQPRNVVQGQSGIEDVFDENYVAIRQRLIQVFGQTDFAQRIPRRVARRAFFSCGAVSITRNPDKIEGGVERNLTRKIDQENGRALENADEDNRWAAKI